MKRTALLNEETFIKALRENDEAVMSRLYKLHFPMVLHLVVLNNGTEDEAKDVYQEAFIVLYENVQRPDFQLRCSIKTFLYSVSRNHWLKRLQAKKIKTDLKDIEEFIPFVEDSVSIEREARLVMVESAMQRLGEPCRTILEDYYLHEMSMAEIAEKMGYTNADNAKTQKYKCFNRLKKIINELK
ncbi:MAG: sigma-70 family RNA polymerase sigma factor [Cytophagales bacterium]|nr:sigma-70 family RNA polymerase sigma factor [Bernardetiaceae bacterium]MDW8204770.1 sigma-70 family RNA polymerase sigma factor [Cytophagales bacterium]